MSIAGVIYKIVCNDTNETYYGSTTNYKQRVGIHLSRTEKQKSKAKCKSWDIINRGNYTFSIVETLICETKTDLLKRERYYIENNECVNKVIPYKTKDEIYESNKKYFIEHKETILEYRANYRKENRERLNKMESERYYKNKDEINKKNREKPPCLCECGISYTIQHKNRHLQTARHKKLLEKNIQNQYKDVI